MGDPASGHPAEVTVSVDPDASAFAKLPGDTLDAKIDAAVKANA